VKLREKYWVKKQPYALHFMMGGDPLAERFVGGTVYQAFLSALSYHRWHAPVSGQVVKTRVIAGAYYSETLAEGRGSRGPQRFSGLHRRDRYSRPDLH
jgi:phosphatidylserine decarboxylase